LKIKKKAVSKEDVKGIMYAVCSIKNKAKGRKWKKKLTTNDTRLTTKKFKIKNSKLKIKKKVISKKYEREK